jgi:hypothetical protein
MTTAQLVNICGGMKIIGFNKTPGKFAREQLADCRLAGA